MATHAGPSTAEPRATRPRPRPAGGGPRTEVRWAIVGPCFLGLTVDYIDRANLSVALPKMKSELGLGPSAEGVILAAFFASYALFQLPAGHLVDRLGARIAYAVSGLWWSLFTATTALAQSLGALLGFRFAPAPASPAATRRAPRR
jgi:ACS family D-galactonate transporter-like MFS transporter